MRKSLNLRKYLNVGFYGLLSAFLVVGFQNCSRPSFQNANTPITNNNSDGGTGIDGKPYLSYGQCSSGDVEVKEKVVVDAQNTAYLVRQDCQDLRTPQELDPSRLKFAAGGTEVFQMDGKVFDLETQAASQKVTLKFCNYAGPSLNVETLIWQTAASTSALFGRVTENAGLSTGVLNIESPSNGVYASVAGQSSEFLLQLGSGISAALTYAIGGGPQNNLPMIECATQDAPPLEDGSAAAPTGAPQKPNQLAGYTARPAWNVAGVDYAVGTRVTPTQNPATLSQAGVSVNTNTRVVTVSGDGVTLDGVDFSLGGGYDLVITGRNVTIINSLFVQSSGMYAVDGRGDGLTISYCVVDGGSSDNVALIGFSGRDLNLEYNWFKNSGRVVQMKQTGSTTSTFSMRYNLLESGIKDGFNYVEIFGGILSDVRIEFNTAIETNQSAPAHGFDFGPTGGATINGILLANNTILATGASSMDYPLNGGGSAVTNGVARDNYFDLSGATAAYRPGTMSGWTSVTAVNMSNGQSF